MENYVDTNHEFEKDDTRMPKAIGLTFNFEDSGVNLPEEVLTELE